MTTAQMCPGDAVSGRKGQMGAAAAMDYAAVFSSVPSRSVVVRRVGGGEVVVRVTPDEDGMVVSVFDGGSLWSVLCTSDVMKKHVEDANLTIEWDKLFDLFTATLSKPTMLSVSYDDDNRLRLNIKYELAEGIHATAFIDLGKPMPAATHSAQLLVFVADGIKEFAAREKALQEQCRRLQYELDTARQLVLPVPLRKAEPAALKAQAASPSKVVAKRKPALKKAIQKPKLKSGF